MKFLDNLFTKKTAEEKAQIREERMKRAEERVARFQARSEELKAKMFVPMHVIGGMPGLPSTVKVQYGNKPGQIKIHNKYYSLLTYQWGEQAARNVGKAAAGAIIGGALTGGVGLIVGGAMGGKKKDKSTLTIVVQDSEGRTFNVTFRCDEKQYGQFSKYCL